MTVSPLATADGKVSVTVCALVFTATLLGVTPLPFTDTLKSLAAGVVLASVSSYVSVNVLPLTLAEESPGAVVSSVMATVLEALPMLLATSTTLAVRFLAPSLPSVLVVIST